MGRHQHAVVQILSHLGQVWVYASHKPEHLTTSMMVFGREHPTFGDETISIASYCFQIFSRVNIEQQECCVNFCDFPGFVCVGSRVPAKPSWFEHWGAREDIPLPNHALNLTGISKLSSTNSQHRIHKIYTGSGHHCGVIPYSSVVCGLPLGLRMNSTRGRTAS